MLYRIGVQVVRQFRLWIWMLMAGSAVNGALEAGDWPQILGPERNGIAREEKLLDPWPRSGPVTLWERSVGSGYAGLAVADGRAILFHRVRGEEVIEALDSRTGATVWKQSYSTTFRPQVGSGDGPLCVPVITGGQVVTFGAQGVLTASDLATGQRLWQRQTHTEYGADEGYFGAGSSPVVIGDRVIVNVGGQRQSAGVVAFDLASGGEVWKAIADDASYSAPVSVDLGGFPHVAVVTRLKCGLLDVKTGAMRFQFPFGSRGPTVNGASPLVWDDHLFVTASYGVGAVHTKFTLLGLEPVWKKDDILSSQYTTPIRIGEHLYGIHGREDIPPADLVCVDLTTGRRTWVEHNFGYATLLYADGKLIAAKTSGELVLMKVDPERATVRSRYRALRGTLRALPALSDGLLFVRDEETLKCLQLGAG